MKTIFSLALATLLLPARAQTTPPAAKPTPTQAKAIRTKTAERRADTYQGPKVVSNSEALGQKMVQKSRPTDGPVRLPAVQVKR